MVGNKSSAHLLEATAVGLASKETEKYRPTNHNLQKHNSPGPFCRCRQPLVIEELLHFSVTQLMQRRKRAAKMRYTWGLQSE